MSRNTTEQGGVRCPICDGPCETVTDTRKRVDHIYRRRRCADCGEGCTTREFVMENLPGPQEVTLRARLEWQHSGLPVLKIEKAEEPTP